MLPTNQGGPGAGNRAAHYARAQLVAAQNAGILPQNFNIAHTNQNLLGQWHMLSGQIGQARHNAGNGGAGDANQQVNQHNIMATIAGLGKNNLATRQGAAPDWTKPYGPGSIGGFG